MAVGPPACRVICVTNKCYNAFRLYLRLLISNDLLFNNLIDVFGHKENIVSKHSNKMV